MKILLIFGMVIMSASLSYAQEITKKNVPSVLYNKFKVNFPKVKDAAWEKIGDLYEVSFEKAKSLDVKLVYDKFGKVMEQTEELLQSNIPADVLNKIQQKYKNWKIDEILKKTSKNNVNYEVKIESGNKEKKLVFNEKGDLIKEN